MATMKKPRVRSALIIRWIFLFHGATWCCMKPFISEPSWFILRSLAWTAFEYCYIAKNIKSSCTFLVITKKIFLLLHILRNFVANILDKTISKIFILSAPRWAIGWLKRANNWMYLQAGSIEYRILRHRRIFRREIMRWERMRFGECSMMITQNQSGYRCSRNTYIAVVLFVSLDRVLAELARSGTSGISIGRQTDGSTGEYTERLQI